MNNIFPSFDQSVLEPLINSIITFSDRTSFFIAEESHSYKDLGKAIDKIRKALKPIKDKYIALVANDDLETYASILALWLEGKCYIPLHPHQPADRNENILKQVGIKYILDSNNTDKFTDNVVINTANLKIDTEIDLSIRKDISDNELLYILFTSGSTGTPKGVPISRKNVAAFVDSFWALGYQLNESDHCLQMFDLTFDLSVQSYLIPLLVGASVYTVATNRIKYEAVFELIDEHELTFMLMVPSVIHYLQPYLDEIFAPTVKYSLFCGEALLLSEVDRWSRCVPNAKIVNVYGPTENTIYCTYYDYLRGVPNKAIGGVVSIGKDMKGNASIIVDENNNSLTTGQKGELCLSGDQLTEGYWHDEEKNKLAFFEKDNIRYYRTGDICSIDANGDYLYHGRLDSQVKIQGYRIELGEIEHIANSVLDGIKSVAVVVNETTNPQIVLCVESENEKPDLIGLMKTKLPPYMIPSSIKYFALFPLNSNGKTDRKKLKTMV